MNQHHARLIIGIPLDVMLIATGIRAWNRDGPWTAWVVLVGVFFALNVALQVGTVFALLQRKKST